MNALERTQTLRRLTLERGDRETCLGCGARGPGEGTSRFNPKASLCPGCALLEALGGHRDPFGLARLPGGQVAA